MMRVTDTCAQLFLLLRVVPVIAWVSPLCPPLPPPSSHPIDFLPVPASTIFGLGRASERQSVSATRPAIDPTSSIPQPPNPDHIYPQWSVLDELCTAVRAHTADGSMLSPCPLLPCSLPAWTARMLLAMLPYQHFTLAALVAPYTSAASLHACLPALASAYASPAICHMPYALHQLRLPFAVRLLAHQHLLDPIRPSEQRRQESVSVATTQPRHPPSAVIVAACRLLLCRWLLRARYASWIRPAQKLVSG